jgi:hypothetical protein
MSRAAPLVICDEVVLAAIERAVRHHPRETSAVPVKAVYDHLGFPSRSGAARRVLARLGVLAGEGLVECSRRHGRDVWALTRVGHRRLQRARRAGEVPGLPESPQHRAWRNARASAAEEIEGCRENMRDCLGQGLLLLDADPPADADAWFLLGRRLCLACCRLGAAVHCLREWVLC